MEDFNDCMRGKYKGNDEGRSCMPLNALALAANEYAGHAMCSLAPLHQRRVRSVPARVVGVMPCGTALALIALATGSAVQHDFMRTGCPVFVDIELRCLRPRRRRLRD